MNINRHPFNTKTASLRYEDSLERQEELLKRFTNGKYNVMGEAFGLAIKNFSYSVALAESKEKILQRLSVLVEMGVILYKTFSYMGNNIAVTLQGNEYRFRLDKLYYRPSYQGFLITFHAAIIAQHKSAINGLGAFNLEPLKNEAFTPSDEYAMHYAKFLQDLYLKEAPHLKQLITASEAINEEKMQPHSFDFALRTVGPQIDLFTSLLTEDEESFNRQLPVALNLHAQYYARTEDDTNSTDAIISIALSAIKRLALTQGFKVAANSDYLTEQLFD